ncbi:MAG: murein biosynthesis integral membrane protein MurJ [Abyssibacter sp.]|uniref:murein biosynthesis integral membrane protein MurJ n=1 Tax=Abyssibacter sp. TaxID=2320200 RepID=UPI00321A792E
MSSVLRSTSVVGGMTLISRVLGFARDALFAILFGAGAGMDAFLVAFKIPNFLRRLFAEGAFAQAFVPVLSATRAKQGDAAVRELIAVSAGTLGVVLLVLTVLGVLCAPAVISVFAIGFVDDPVKFEAATSMLRWTFPYLFLIAMTSLFAGVLNTYGRFAVPAFAPVWLNVCLITAAVLFAPSTHALAVAVLVAGVVQLGFHLPSVVRLGLWARPRADFAHPQVRRILRMMGPILFGSSVAQINLLLDTILASLLVTGSISWLYFADRLMEFPLGVFSIALATVIMPRLAGQHASGDAAQFRATLDWAFRLLFLLGVPAAVGLFVLAGPLVTTLFQYNAFSAADVEMTRLSLMAYALGFFGFSLVKILTPAFYAREDAKTPVRCGVIALSLTMVLNVAFVSGLTALGVAGVHAGLALGTSLGAFINAGLLYRALRHRMRFRISVELRNTVLRSMAAAVVMAVAVGAWAGPVGAWIDADVLTRVWRLAVAVLGGGLIYALALVLLGVRPRQLRLADGPVNHGDAADHGPV